MARRPWFFDPYPHVLGGAQRTVVRLAAGLRAEGDDARLVVPAEGPVADLASTAGVPVEVVATPTALGEFGRALQPGVRVGAALASYAFRLARVFRRGGVDLVHANDLRGALLAGPAARFARRPLVWHVHSLEPPGMLMTAAARMAAHVIVPSHAALSMLPAVNRPGRVSVIGAAVDERWLTEAGDREGHGIACVARFESVKGLDTLLDAMAVLRTTRPDATLTIVGGRQAGHEAFADIVEARASSDELAGSVTLAGDVDPLPVVRGCRVYVQPSRSETFGMAALEAMAAGRAVVATDVGGLVELLDGGRFGVLVPPGEPVALAAAIDGLLGDPGRVATLGAAARDHARRIGDPAARIDAVRAVHEAVLR